MSDDPWDDWETAADAGLINIPKKTTQPSSSDNQRIWQKANEYATPIIIHSDTRNALHTEYKPELKILKRPSDPKNKKEKAMEKTIKPLADREKEYLEAKRKIFEKFENK